MRKIIAIPFTIVHLVLMGLLLLVFHPIQVIAFNTFGLKAQKPVVDFLNALLVANFYTLLCKPSFYGFKELPKNIPFIIVSNHQSMHDISPIAWGFRKHHAKFISKKELGKNLPSVSYNLKKGGSVLIDRKNGAQSIKEILKLGKKMEHNNWSALIFPEGTRSRNGQLRKFQPGGFKTLLKASPSALIVPFVINGNHKLQKWGAFPLNIGIHLKFTALEPIKRNEFESDEALLDEIRNRIEKKLST